SEGDTRAGRGEEVGPNAQANHAQGERVEQLPKAVTRVLRDHDHSRGKVAGGGRSLNRASTWRAAAETARAPAPSSATPRPRSGRRGSRDAARHHPPTGQTAPHRNAASPDAPPRSP